MKKLISYSLLVLLLWSCSNSNKSSLNDAFEVNFKEVAYGICETNTNYKVYSETSPSGNHSISNNFKLIKQTDKIPAIVGQKFGMQYILESKISRLITLEHVWTFPKTMTNKIGQEFKELRYTAEKSTNRITYNTYVLEEDFEVVKGKWTYQMFCKGKKLYERDFYLE